MESLFEEMVNKGLVEAVKGTKFTVALASSVPYRFYPYEIDRMFREIWRFN